jgi:hypothetical protein
VWERDVRNIRMIVLRKRDQKKEKTLYDCVGRKSKEEEFG